MHNPSPYVDFLIALLIPTFAVLYSAAKDDRVALVTAYNALLDNEAKTLSDVEYDQVHWITGVASRESAALVGIVLAVAALALAMFEAVIGFGIAPEVSFLSLLAFLVVQVTILLLDERRATGAWRSLRRQLDRNLKPGRARRVGSPRFR